MARNVRMGDNTPSRLQAGRVTPMATLCQQDYPALTPFRMNTYAKQGEGGPSRALPTTHPPTAHSPNVCNSGNARHMRHVTPLSPVPSFDCTYFPSPRRCTVPPLLATRRFRFLHLQSLPGALENPRGLFVKQHEINGFQRTPIPQVLH